MVGEDLSTTCQVPWLPLKQCSALFYSDTINILFFNSTEASALLTWCFSSWMLKFENLRSQCKINVQLINLLFLHSALGTSAALLKTETIWLLSLELNTLKPEWNINAHIILCDLPVIPTPCKNDFTDYTAGKSSLNFLWCVCSSL